MFFILCLLNTPIMMTYFRNGYQYKTVQWYDNHLLSYFTFGIVGSDQYGCESQNLKIFGKHQGVHHHHGTRIEDDSLDEQMK